MNIQLIQGKFIAQDAMDILTQMIDVKVRYHENKISQCANEEDIKYRENKIKKLQNELSALRNTLYRREAEVTLQAVVEMEV